MTAEQRLAAEREHHGKQADRAQQPLPPAQHEAQQRGQRGHGVEHVVAQHHRERERGAGPGEKPAARLPGAHGFQAERKGQRKAAGEEHVLGRIDGHHHVQRVEGEEQRAAPRGARAALARDGGARQRKAQGEQRHLKQRIERRPGVYAACQPPQRDAAAQQQRVQQRVVGGICAGEHLLELKWHVIGERAGERDCKHGQVTKKEQGKGAARAKDAIFRARQGLLAPGVLKQQKGARGQRAA